MGTIVRWRTLIGVPEQHIYSIDTWRTCRESMFGWLVSSQLKVSVSFARLTLKSENMPQPANTYMIKQINNHNTCWYLKPYVIYLNYLFRILNRCNPSTCAAAPFSATKLYGKSQLAAGKSLQFHQQSRGLMTNQQPAPQGALNPGLSWLKIIDLCTTVCTHTSQIFMYSIKI